MSSPLPWLRCLVLILTLSGNLLVQAEEESPAEPAALERLVKDFALKDVISGKEIKLSDHKDNIVVLMWHSPSCMASPLYEKRVKAFIDSYKDKKVVLLGINSSSGDTENGLKSYAKDQKLTFPILRDADQAIAQYFSISQTSMFLVIDTKGKLRYSGGFDDNVNMNMVRRQYVKKAVDSILANKRFLLRKTFSFG
jgi:peroxiredoxin|tara:strand:- start:193 stop:780 length:588 start_codon:yes stop_codon:yes gene_type:complete